MSSCTINIKSNTWTSSLNKSGSLTKEDKKEILWLVDWKVPVTEDSNTQGKRRLNQSGCHRTYIHILCSQNSKAGHWAYELYTQIFKNCNGYDSAFELGTQGYRRGIVLDACHDLNSLYFLKALLFPSLSVENSDGYIASQFCIFSGSIDSKFLRISVSISMTYVWTECL